MAETFRRMIREGFIEEKWDGNERILKMTPKGYEELKRLQEVEEDLDGV
jgi:predicted transcriptional regulator